MWWVWVWLWILRVSVRYDKTGKCQHFFYRGISYRQFNYYCIKGSGCGTTLLASCMDHQKQIFAGRWSKKLYLTSMWLALVFCALIFGFAVPHAKVKKPMFCYKQKGSITAVGFYARTFAWLYTDYYRQDGVTSFQILHTRQYVCFMILNTWSFVQCTAVAFRLLLVTR